MNARLRDDHYRSNSVQTASPARLLTMLYDRLVLDLTTAEAAIRSGDTFTASENLVHAQDIVHELAVSLDVDRWTGGPALKQIYDFLQRELISANIQKSETKLAACRRIVEPLRDTWHEAARQLA